MSDETARVLTALEKTERGRLVARLIRITGDWSLAEDCVQDAIVRAWKLWPLEMPEKPAAWLAVTARNLALDRWRRAKLEGEKLRLWDAEETSPPSGDDDRLALIFTCCHPALALEGQVALTLRSVAGLTTQDVARALLVSEATMTRRLTRAKTKIQAAGIPFAVPDDAQKYERLQGVLGVLYLLFNQGNDAGPDEHARATLAGEAIGLGRLLKELLPREGEATGVLSLMLLTNCRRPARFDGKGPVTLDRQDRTLWNRVQLKEGLDLLDEALTRGKPGPYTLQAAIAGCHARATSVEQTDFGLIAGLYSKLESLLPTPVVRLNHAVAVGFAQGPEAGLTLLDALREEPGLAAYHLLFAARADFLGRAGRWSEATESWEQALALAPGPWEREFLEGRRTYSLNQIPQFP